MFKRFLLVLVIAIYSSVTCNALTSSEILEQSDRARGGGVPGIEWTLDMVTVEPNKDTLHEIFIIKAADTNSLATTTFPKRLAGGKLLQVKNNMWYVNPKIRKAISITPRQKLSGPAAVGDIAATNYSLDYNSKLLAEEMVNGKPAYVLYLTGKNKWVTYDRIKYWVDKASMVPVKAEFYTVSGKLFKNAVFENGNKILFNGKQYPFVSKMIIKDQINDKSVSTLVYKSVKVRRISPLEFDHRKLKN